MGEAIVAIEKLCYGGAGFGRLDGKACFVPFTAPGDRARIRIVKEKSSFLEGQLVGLEVSSPLRVAPPCPAFGVCGGCHWQHLPYQEQLKQKGAIFSESLRRIGKLEADSILPVAASPNCLGYRSRIQLKHARKNGATVLGFFKSASHDIIDLPYGCAIADPLLNRIAAELRPLLARLPEPNAIPQIDLALGEGGKSIAVLHFKGGDPAKLMVRLREARADLPSVSGLFLLSTLATPPRKSGGKGGRAPRPVAGKRQLEHVFGIDSLEYLIPAGLFPGSREMRLRFSKGGFSQVNYPQNLELIRTVQEWGGFTGGERVLDLYCGNGNISVPLSGCVGEVVGIEGYAPSIEDAAANAAANGVENASFQVSDASQALRRMVKRGERFDVVLLDPPRGGAEAAAEIAQLSPEKILYVSCDPATLARDLGTLGQQGYRVTRSRPVDMFPQTYHLESVTELVKI
ncbi:23S rRNA (uracil(1939)-C(5))-methyltransferase RlmD [Geomonas sp.]|uniref:23S rRNA (uracil(1939)-C(5))-methyltransferase RlmD n=1 Tax=Geomonas sp. TaxID=2651584 RepID=UPI002B47754F|nr:23S rRNA (uracil(1939)-C(5))-methyltransferase RlmD [Geomonas sp.]HJV33984.1 23S rRNA (uracil(1939)-C(5))-methyltransferase RlmD [Geomonas sp.]